MRWGKLGLMGTAHRALAVTVALSVLAPLVDDQATPIAQAKPSKQRRKKPRAVEDADWAKAPSSGYANLGKDACIRELKARQIAFREVDEARGVLAPVRLSGPLGGVDYHTEASKQERQKSPFEIFDCRLVLALHDFSSILVAHGVDEALVFSSWRPPPKGWPAGKLATRHPGALAVDIRKMLKKADGQTAERGSLEVERDWLPAIDKPACGDKASPVLPNDAAGQEIRAIYCEAADKRIFSSMLGPNFNAAHHNHFHLEITPGVKWRLTL